MVPLWNTELHHYQWRSDSWALEHTVTYPTHCMPPGPSHCSTSVCCPNSALTAAAAASDLTPAVHSVQCSHAVSGTEVEAELCGWNNCLSLLCWSLAELWFVLFAGQKPTVSMDRLCHWQWNPKVGKLPLSCRHPHSFQTLSWNSASWPSLSSLSCSFVRPCIWHFENFSALLWNPICSQKVILHESFTRSFSLVMPILHHTDMPVLHDTENEKFMTSLIIKLYGGSF